MKTHCDWYLYCLSWEKSKTGEKIYCDKSSPLGWKSTPLIKLIDVMQVHQCDYN